MREKKKRKTEDNKNNKKKNIGKAKKILETLRKQGKPLPTCNFPLCLMPVLLSHTFFYVSSLNQLPFIKMGYNHV